MPPSLAQNFHPENIPNVISKLRPDTEAPLLHQEYFDGGQCRVYKADFHDGESWAVRIPIHVRSESEENIIAFLQGEQAVLREINEIGFPWAPKLHEWSFTFDNLIGYPFLALSWIKGSPLNWTSTDPPKPIRDRVLAQIAEIHVSLIESTKENKGPATEFFSRIIANKFSRVRNGQLPELSEQDCSDQQNLLPHVLHSELEHLPFAMDHGDLSPKNIIVDSEYNVTGIIDWGFAAKVPVQMAGRMPCFLQLGEPGLSPSLTLQEDREAYITALRSSCLKAASWIMLIHSPADVDFRHFYLESIISKGMHKIMARLGWKLSPY